jgi:DNA-binding response OmpR family regulator
VLLKEEKARKDPMDSSRSLKGVRVAVIEDDRLLGDALAIYLRVKGCQVVTFRSAEEASEVGNWGDFGVVISDFLLPGEDGLSVLRRARKSSKTITTVLITASGRKDLADRARLAGVDVFLPKPFSAEELEDALRC